MRSVRVANRTRGVILGNRVAVADRWWLRLRGLLGRSELSQGEGLLLKPCKAVHMAGMAFPLDVGFLDADGRLIALYPELPPRARTRWHSRALQALELPAGTFAATGSGLGDVLETTSQPLGATP
ncbi:MAG: DUF192 domain-containing protein [Chloroflexi bacterium]|nr:DUF192 domain-containing protein [Chloroflexota bacterium]